MKILVAHILLPSLGHPEQWDYHSGYSCCKTIFAKISNFNIQGSEKRELKQQASSGSQLWRIIYSSQQVGMLVFSRDSISNDGNSHSDCRKRCNDCDMRSPPHKEVRFGGGSQQLLLQVAEYVYTMNLQVRPRPGPEEFLSHTCPREGATIKYNPATKI